MLQRAGAAFALGALLATGAAAAPQGDHEWIPAPGRLQTRWAAVVDPKLPLPEYPRPQLRRAEWQNLNGLWEYAVLPRTEESLDFAAQGEILVPFAIESSLSGVGERVGPDERLWYRRSFRIPESWKGRNVRLNFGAVDWHAMVWVDDRFVGEHFGGYDPFTFDITGPCSLEVDPTDFPWIPGFHRVVIAVWDPTDAGTQPRGKQIRSPHGIWYTPTTGIWQTVWLEPVHPLAIDGLRMRAELGETAEDDKLWMSVQGRDLRGLRVKYSFKADGEDVRYSGAFPGHVERNVGPGPWGRAHRWTPDDPFLYDIVVEIEKEETGEVVDRVETYFGFRTIEVAPDDVGRPELYMNGTPRLLLNGEPLFQLGTLDQGFWPDGLYTAPTDEALRYDLEVTKQLGFNMVRKHVKVEPARWYRHCDELGLLVWQDLPSGDRYIGPDDPDIERGAYSARQYEVELRRMIATHYNHPSIVAWVPFNEGWGQFDTARIARWTKELDPTRLVDAVSGWADRGVGDVHDVHVYPGPGSPPLEARRAAVLGEFGGLGLPLAGHTWLDEGNWGYRSYESSAALTHAYVAALEALRVERANGLAAAVYTQTTDVEVEVNGLMTYDRAVVKMDAARVAEANRRVHLPPPSLEVVLPTARERKAEWRYVKSAPGEGWSAPDFDDSSWERGPGGFGTADTPGAELGTEWSGDAIWLRRAFELPAGASSGDLRLAIHHDEDAVVYLNGREVARLGGYTTGYVLARPDVPLGGVLRPGLNVLAVSCRQTGGGQFVDVGVTRIVEPGE